MAIYTVEVVTCRIEFYARQAYHFAHLNVGVEQRAAFSSR